MKAPRGYDKARPYSGESRKLTPGGHIVRIRNVTDEFDQNGSEFLMVTFDIEEGGEYDGFFNEKFKTNSQYNVGAAWPGSIKVYVYDRESGETSGRFKGFIQAVEASNGGYNFAATNYNEHTLQGKLVGMVFGEDEYNVNGNRGWTVRARYAVPVSKVREGIAPPRRRPLQTNEQPAEEVPTDDFYNQLPF